MRNYIMATLLLSATFLTNANSVNSSTPHPAPQIIAHRGGTADAAENTLPAIKKALANGANAIWITLQLSKDNKLVLYRPSDLKELTDMSGKVSAYTAEQLARANASFAYNQQHDIHPAPKTQVGIPTLDEVLKTFPTTTFYLDIKSPDAAPATLAQALQKTLNATTRGEKNRLSRTRVYSTDDNYLNALDKVNQTSDSAHKIQRFESRNVTRTQVVTQT